jgi:ribosomal protein S27E
MRRSDFALDLKRNETLRALQYVSCPHEETVWNSHYERFECAYCGEFVVFLVADEAATTTGAAAE